MRISICMGSTCMAEGAIDIKNEFERLAKEKAIKLEIVSSGCKGPCEGGPVVVVDDVVYTKVKPSDVEEIIDQHIIGGKVVERLLFKENGKAKKKREDIDFFKSQVKIILGDLEKVDPDSIESYLEIGGYKALEKVLKEMDSQKVIDEVKKSGLRGRGGAGFPTGVKWQFVKDQDNDTKYVICNGDEGDPGAFMDRAILEGSPHTVIEGMIIAGYAVGAKTGYLYVRAEYPLAIKRLEKAIEEARAKGYLGKNILGTDFEFDLFIRKGAGAFVCGEETALIASIEGKRGMPRPKPPFPAVSGLWGKPTLINNVETYANIRHIILKGADWFASIGTEKSKGTKIFALAGKINNTGLVEVPMGITLRQLIFEIGGGIPNGKKFKAVQLGGPSGGCIPEEYLDTPIDYESLQPLGAIMGSGGIIVMDEETCMVDVAKFFLSFTQDESCGKCTPCREGTKRMLDILEKITNGEGTEEDLETLEWLGNMIKQTALCGLGQTAPNPVLTTLRYFKDEYLAHIKDKKCPAGVCKGLLAYKIIEDKCRGCTACKKVCPVNAIEGQPGKVHKIDPQKCIKCGACYEACKFNAITRG